MMLPGILKLPAAKMFFKVESNLLCRVLTTPGIYYNWLDEDMQQ